MKHDLLSRITSKWAILLCLTLYDLTFILMALAMMQADDLNRPMTSIEVILGIPFILTAIWLIIIIYQKVKILIASSKRTVVDSIVIFALVIPFVSGGLTVFITAVSFIIIGFIMMYFESQLL